MNTDAHMNVFGSVENEDFEDGSWSVYPYSYHKSHKHMVLIVSQLTPIVRLEHKKRFEKFWRVDKLEKTFFIMNNLLLCGAILFLCCATVSAISIEPFKPSNKVSDIFDVC